MERRAPPPTVEWIGALPGRVRLIDQTRLPLEVHFLEVDRVPQMVDAIRRLAVRGAPAIGVAAAYGSLLGIQTALLEGREDTPALLRRFESDAEQLAKSRPTAINLFWALERMTQTARGCSHLDPLGFTTALWEEAKAIHREDAAMCRRMGEFGAALVPDGKAILTHCNAGALATGGMGTALAPIYVAREQGKDVSVYADETRPLLQGARLTAFELREAAIGVTLITDNMAARVMAEGKVAAVFVGSDRIAANGDVCNKIGTYGVAVLARYHNLPFYVVAPTSTFDPRVPTGAHIPIEERAEEEVTEGLGRRTAPLGISVYNPAFDVTPADLVTAIITEAGIIERPNRERVQALLQKARHQALSPSA